MHRFTVAACFACAAIGCGEEGGEIVETVPVTGFVTYQGKPLMEYQVVFVPKDGRPAVGKTNSEGHFTLGTNQEEDGAVVGTHKVAVKWLPVVPGEPGKEDFSKPLPKAPIELPPKYDNAETSGVTVEVPPEGLQDYKIELK